ncbi:hypothetical protein HWV62_2274 [Athelia sp. TMB]|nr:hypothetical protein HWV62_2274 [Athelia sp. TMB]
MSRRMPKNAQLASRFSSDGEDSLIDRIPKAIDLTARVAFQPTAIPDVPTAGPTGATEKENNIADSDATSPRRRRKSTFIRRLTSKLRLSPHASNPQSPPPGPLSPSHTASPISPRAYQHNGHAPIQPGYFPVHPTPPPPDLSVQEKEHDRQLDAYFPTITDDTLSEDDEEEWMTEARRIREDLETRWHSDGSGVRKTPIYPETLATPQFCKAKSTTDLRAPEPAPHFEVVREFTVLRPPRPPVIPTVELVVDDEPPINAATTGGLQPPSATGGGRIRAHSLSPRASRISLKPPPGPPPDRELPAIPPSSGPTLAVPGVPLQPQSPVVTGNGQVLRTRQSASTLKDEHAPHPSSRTSETDSAGSVPFPSSSEGAQGSQGRPTTPSPAQSKRASKGAAIETPTDDRGRSQRRKSFVEQSLESLRKSFSKSRAAKPPPVPPKFDASQLPPPPHLPLPPPSPTSGSFQSSDRSSAASALSRPSGHP